MHFLHVVTPAGVKVILFDHRTPSLRESVAEAEGKRAHGHPRPCSRGGSSTKPGGIVHT